MPDIQIKKKKKILRRLRWNFIFSNLICYSFILNGVMTRKIIIIKNKRGSVLAGSWFNVGELKLCNIGDRIHGACQEPNPVIPVAISPHVTQRHTHTVLQTFPLAGEAWYVWCRRHVVPFLRLL